MMEYFELIIGLVLAAIVPINIFLQGYYSKIEKRTELFKKHFTCYWIDWIFVLFNFFWIYAVDFDLLYWAASLFVSLILNLIAHHYLANMEEANAAPSHLFNRGEKRILPAGFVHLVFSIIETAMLLIFIFSSLESFAAYIEICIIIAFFLLVPYGSKKIHGRVIPYDWIFFCCGIIVVIGKLVWLNK